ncbi:hypothetical protein BGX29_004790 [Mortierella sp. GBA35]|nr:hypothetical protein BGX29_004790 [Mortierella sp. GBA35]KAG0204338.1 hypothetical protein BGX33_008569 [Mortierella sp. NVP41]
MAPVKTRSTSSKHSNDRYKADPEDTNDDDDIYGMRELKHQLAGLNLQLKDTMGDGNCLFRACADQFSGTERDHQALRVEVCQYIEDHEEHFKLFLDNETVEAHVAKMRRNGTYGGNIELVAFARMKKVDIKVYQPGYIYVIEGVDVKKEGSSLGQRPVMHIAYHSWEHYSSIRNIDGPFEGPPEINPRPVKQEPLRKLTNQDPPRSIERSIMNVSGVDDLELVRELLEKYKGDVDSVYNDLADKMYQDANGAEEEEGEVGVQDKSTDPQDQQDKDAETSPDDKGKESKSLKQDKDPASRNNAQPATPLSEAQKESGSTEDSSSYQTTATTPSSEPVKGIVPKKRISTREKREAAKRNQKLNRKNKGKTNPSEGANDKPSTPNGADKINLTTSSSTMRELFV